MLFYKPLFSVFLIAIQLILSIRDYFDFVAWGKENPELDQIINRYFLSDKLFLFVLAIGLCEMLTKPGWFKSFARFFLIGIILGSEFSEFIPIEGFFYGVYNTASFSAVVAFLVILFRLGKFIITKRKLA